MTASKSEEHKTPSEKAREAIIRPKTDWFQEVSRSVNVKLEDLMKEYNEVYASVKDEVDKIWDSTDDKDSAREQIKQKVTQILLGNHGIGTKQMDIEEAKKLHKKDFEATLDISKLPKDHFLLEYLDNVRTTDAYEDFHVLTGLWDMAVFSRNKFKASSEDGDVKLNVDALILSKTGTGKTPSMNKGKKLVEEVTGETCFDEEYSKEGYRGRLWDKSDSNGYGAKDIVFKDEAGGMFATFNKPVNQGIYDDENKIYDGDADFRKTLTATKKGGKPFEVIARKPFVNYLRGTTPSRFLKVIPFEVVELGWLFRKFVAHPAIVKRKRKYFRPKTKQSIDSWNELVRKTKALYEVISQMPETTFTFTDEAQKCLDSAFDKIYDEIDKREKEGKDEVYEEASNKSKLHIIKLAGLIEIFKNISYVLPKVSTTIQKDSVEIASDWVLNYFLPMNVDIYETMRDGVDEKNLILKVLNTLKKHGGVMQRQYLLKHSRLFADQLDKSLDTLIKSGDIELVNDNKGRGDFFRLIKSK